MIELFEQNLQGNAYQSSKGNQLKWMCAGYWYKADYAGYEGLAEYVVSHLLRKSSLGAEEYIVYDTEQIKYRKQMFSGCKSKNFLAEGGQLITLERLFHQHFGRSLYKSLFQIQNVEERAVFLTDQVQRLTGIKDFGIYLCKLLSIDAFFLNEDRHMHNIAVILGKDGRYHPAPIFDQGACLLSDLTMDYPLNGNIYDMVDEVQAKTLSDDFDEQLDAVELLYGDQIHFSFTKRDVEELLRAEPYYPEAIKCRVRDIVYDRMRKYRYMCT